MTGTESVLSDRVADDERRFIEQHGHVNEIAVGTILEYDDWQWALVCEVAADRDEPKFGFILLDEVGDHIIAQLGGAIGCREHYETVAHLRDSEHEHWTSVNYVLHNDVWQVLGPIHPEYREVADAN